LSSSTPSIKDFLDVLWDVDPQCIDVGNLKAVIRDKAWEELPEVLTLKLRPTFAYIFLFFPSATSRWEALSAQALHGQG